MRIRILLVAALAGVLALAATADAAPRQKVQGHFIFETHEENCAWGIGIEFSKVRGATAYDIKYYDGYYKQVVAGTFGESELVSHGGSTLYLGITGGTASPPCPAYVSDPTGGGRFTKPPKIFALFPEGYQPPEADGIDWVVPSRLDDQSWSASDGLLSEREVNPPFWKVSLFLTRNRNPVGGCRSGTEWRWKVDAPKGAEVVSKPKEGCSTKMEVSELGTYKVTATKYERRKGKLRKTSTSITKKVVVKDWLIVGMGDSNGSGEGNPPFRFEQCNRSEGSYQWRVANYVERHDARSSVTFVFPACSGAIIQDLYKTQYTGIIPGRPLDPQIKQAARLIARPGNERERSVDAAIVSIGVNNLGFGPLLAYCVTHFDPSDSCEHRYVNPVPSSRGGIEDFQTSSSTSAPTLRAAIETLVTDLPPKYGPLGKALSAPLSLKGNGALGVKRKDVVITQYPDFTRGDDGQLCSGTIGPQSTWDFIATEAAGLNAAVASGAASQGWRLVTMPQSAFTGPPGHGYCASDPYFVSLTGALAAGNKPGAFHPNGAGHNITAEAARAKVCAALYGNAKCDGVPG